MLSRHLPLLIFVSLINLSKGFSQNSALNLADLNNLVQISNPQLADDGKSGLFTLTNIDIETNSRKTALFWIDIQSGNQHSLGQHKGLSQPRWIPGGKSVSFIASSDSGRQVFKLTLDGGKPVPLTKAKNSIRRYAWSPDGNSLAYITSDPVPEPVNKYNNAVKLGNNDYLMDSPPTTKSLWVYNIATGDAKKISPAGKTVGTGLSTSGIIWSPDGNKITFVTYPSAYSGDSDLGRIHIADIESGKIKPVTENTGMESPMAFSNNGKKLYFSYKRDGIAANISDVHVVDLAGGNIKNITRSLDRTIYGLEILANDELVLLGLDTFRFKIWQSSKNGGFKAIDLDDLVNLSSWSINKNGAMLFTAQGKYETNQLYYRASLNSPIKKLTRLNGFLSQKNLGNQEGISWPSSNGLTANGIITYPPAFDENKKYPLILYIHGGPTSSSRLGFHRYAQLMAAQGWIIFQPNYRGSNNLGNEFQAAIANDPSEGPGQDVMAGVKLLQAKPYIDKDKIAVSGWSYGGWMTSWLIGRYPETWVAAVAGAAPVDFTDMYSLNDLNRMRRHAITDSPYKDDNLQWAFDNSPISNFSKIKAPTLIMSKTADSRVTITGSYKLYGALRDNNIPVQFIGYPGPGHFPADPVRANDVWQRWLGWLSKYVGGISDETLPVK
jgi:dipeptidyl aminopeptidase/acylaminoacyl peptidase